MLRAGGGRQREEGERGGGGEGRREGGGGRDVLPCHTKLEFLLYAATRAFCEGRGDQLSN